ncbi:hypothetical protein [Phyllobacterium phragmitis]|uniref:hypothetical protein n=1 Tax=Phyllobacterium phragmitis TaxID=2670329 RepID=UPI003CCA26D4
MGSSSLFGLDAYLTWADGRAERVAALQHDRPRTIALDANKAYDTQNLHGKGDKWRICPLWPETACLLGEMLRDRRQPATPATPVFLSNVGKPLTRFGLYKLVWALWFGHSHRQRTQVHFSACLETHDSRASTRIRCRRERHKRLA